MTRHWVLVLLCVVGWLGSGDASAAAEPAHTLGVLTIKPGTRVIVETADGRELRGRLETVSAAAIEMTLTRGSLERVADSEVRRIWVPDSLRNGAWLGGLLGAAAAVMGQSRCTECAGDVALGLVVGVPFWAGVGALIDAQHHGRRLIFDAGP